MSKVMTLAEFLLARIAEREALAHAAAAATDGSSPWWVDGPGEKSGKWWVYATGAKFASRDVAEHIAASDPARVLAECEAMRRIVGEHLPGGEDGKSYCGCCWLDDLRTWEPYPCPTMRAVASVYADHPDYQEAWRV